MPCLFRNSGKCVCSDSGRLFVALALLLHPKAFPSPPCRRSDAGFSYGPSKLELQWVTGDVSERICEIATAQIPDVHRWLRAAGEWRGNHTQQSSEVPSGIMSHFRCSDGRTAFIEPLTGIARHPLAMLGCDNDARKKCYGDLMPIRTGQYNKARPAVSVMKVAAQHMTHDIFDISYLVLENQCGHGKATPEGTGRNLFYDLGCSVYGDGRVPDLSKGTAEGPSIPLFNELYRRNCIAFDRIWAWEKSSQSHVQWWSSVPPEMRHKLAFFNVPVSPEPSKNHNDSFFEFLRASAHPNDFVVLKVDLDISSVELSIVRGIAYDPDLARLVDELFFEYHFEFDDIDFGWGDSGRGQNVNEVLALFKALRRQGIRAHFWI